MAWAYGAYIGGRMLVLVSTAILARLLTPADFGVVALALVFMTFLDAIRDLGLGQALILASPEEEAARAQTVFSWSVVFGLGLTVAMTLLAPLAASFFHEPDLKGIVPVLGFTFLLRSLGTTHYALARKHLNYRVRTVSEISEVTVRGIVGIALALGGFGAWSLVIGFVAGVAASTIALWALVPFRPRPRLTRTHLRDLLSFGGLVTFIDIGAVVFYNLDYLFIGRILGANALGLYTIGFRIPELVILNIAHVAGDVLFPAYTELGRERLREGYLTTLRYTTMLTLPIAVGLVVLARPLILVAFGDQWTGSIDVARVVAVYALFATLAIPPGTVLKVTRRLGLMAAIGTPQLAVLVVLLVIYTPEGILAVAIATAALQAVAPLLQTIIVSRQLELPLRASARALVPTVTASLAMGAVLLPLEHLISEPLPDLLVCLPLGAAVYLGVLWFTARDDLLRLRGMALPGRAAAAG